jgi:hypothetical protein
MSGRLRPALPVAVLCLAGALAGCAASAEKTEDSDLAAALAAEGYPRAVISNDGTWCVGSRADPPALSRPFDLALAIAPADGAIGRLEAITIAVDCTMPQHGHGMEVVPEVERVAPGRYVVRGLELFMEGEWLVTVDITEGTETERTQWWVEPR